MCGDDLFVVVVPDQLFRVHSGLMYICNQNEILTPKSDESPASILNNCFLDLTFPSLDAGGLFDTGVVPATDKNVKISNFKDSFK